METKQCEKCGAMMKLVQAGISKKTGKHYEAFWSCPNNREKGCPTVRTTDPRPQGWGKIAENLGKETDYGKVNAATEMLLQLQRMNRTLTSILEVMQKDNFDEQINA